MAYFGFTNSIT